MVRDPDSSRRLPTSAEFLTPERIRRLPPDAKGRRTWTTARAGIGVPPPLSGVMWDFAAPLLGSVEDLDPEEVDGRIHFAMAVWNAVVMEQHEGDAEPLRILRNKVVALGDVGIPDLPRLLEDLRLSKLERYASDARIAVAASLTLVDGAYDLQILSNGPAPG